MLTHNLTPLIAIFAGVWTLFAASIGYGQDFFGGVHAPFGAATEAPSKQLSDFDMAPERAAQVFEAVHRLGWPRLPKDATRLPGHSYTSLYQLRSSGWTWKDTNGTERVVYDDGRLVAEKNNANRYGVYGSFGAAPGDPTKEKDKDATKKFAATLQVSLNQRIKQMSYTSRQDWPKAVLLATALNDIGQDVLARQMLGLVFEKTENPKELSLLCLNQLADAAFQDAHNRFEPEGWLKLAEEVETLLGRFPRGWIHAVEAQKLAAGYRVRVTQPPPPLTPPEGLPWKPVFQDIADTLLVETNPAQFIDTTAFFHRGTNAAIATAGSSEFPGGWTSTGYPASATTSATTKALIKEGPAAVSLLIALLDDQSFIGGVSSRNASRSYTTYSSSGEPELELKGFLTRGEVAQGLLRSILPHPENDPGMLGRQAKAWMQRVDLDDPGSLFLDRFERSTRPTQVAPALLALNRPELDRALLKRLERPPAAPQLGLATAYASARGLEARAALSNYVARVKAEQKKPAEADDFGGRSDPYRGFSEGGSVKSQLRVLEKLLAQQTADEVIAGIYAGTANLAEEQAFLTKKLTRKPNDSGSDYLDRILPLAENAKDHAQLGPYFLNMLYYVTVDSLTSEQGKIWQALIDNEDQNMTASFALLQTLGESDPYGGRSLHRTEYSRVKARAMALAKNVSREEAPKLPDAKHVAEEKRAPALAALLKAEDTAKALGELEPSMRHALWAHLQGLPSNEVAKASVSLNPHLNRITWNNIETLAEQDQATLKMLAEQPVGPEFIRELTTWSEAQRDAGKSMSVILMRQNPLHGWTMQITNSKPRAGARYYGQTGSVTPTTTLMVYATPTNQQTPQRLNRSLILMADKDDKDDKPDKAKPTASPDDDIRALLGETPPTNSPPEQQQAFDASVKELHDPSSSITLFSMIYYTWSIQQPTKATADE